MELRSGLIGINNGRLGAIGLGGYGWSSRSFSSAANAYNFFFGASGVSPSGTNFRHYGFPLRCLARSWNNKEVNLGGDE